MANALYSYLLAAIVAWTHVPADCYENPRPICPTWEHVYGEPPEDAQLRFSEIADQIAYEATVRGGTVRYRFETALKLVSVGFEESSLALRVDRGYCNRAPRGKHDCDGGTSYGAWQMRPATLRDVYPLPLTGLQLVYDRPLQIRIGWDLMRIRPQAWSTYAKAERRAAVWMVEHPVPQ